jgi:SAM-dependent methyltransferase
MVPSRARARVDGATADAPTAVLAVDAVGLRLDLGRDLAIIVSFDGSAVWSTVPTRDGRPVDGDWVVDWPGALVPFLDGTADVVLTEMPAGVVLYDGQVRFTDTERRVRVVDAEGAPAAIDKTGRLNKVFSGASPEAIAAVVEAVDRALSVLNDVAGVPAFLAFGPLLGAVRDGHLIAHDNDADVSYLATGTHPLDVILESYRLERLFRARGWQTIRMSGADFKLVVPWLDGGTIGIDVFTAFYVDEWLHVMPTVRARLPRSTLLPLSSIELDGRQVPAPAIPEDLLQATYGDGWRVPDPSFVYRPARTVRRRLTGWMRGERRTYRRWEEFYRDRSESVSPEPSAFATWVADREQVTTELLDVGAGTGRDARFFARQDHRVTATELSPYALYRLCDDAAEDDNLSAGHNNLYDLRDVLALGTRLANFHQVSVVYARLLLDALAPDGRRNLWRLARMALLGRPGRIYLEWRMTDGSRSDRPERGWYDVDPDDVAQELVGHGFAVEHREVSRGFARRGDDDPLTCRLVARIQQPDRRDET